MLTFGIVAPTQWNLEMSKNLLKVKKSGMAYFPANDYSDAGM